VSDGVASASGFSKSRGGENAGHTAEHASERAHGVHARGHIGILTNNWHAQVRPTWRLALDELQSELGLGPKSKVVAHTMLYIFYLRCIVIRAMD
jgi:hypothetical protein